MQYYVMCGFLWFCIVYDSIWIPDEPKLLRPMLHVWFLMCKEKLFVLFRLY